METKSKLHGFVHHPDFAKFILRFTVGFLMIFHGIGKMLHGITFIQATVVQAGLPEFFAYLVYVGEVVAPAMLILGIFTRGAGLIIAINMVFTILLAFKDTFFTLNQYGGWVVELNMFYLLASLAIVFLGGGKYSVMREKCC